MSKYSHIFKSNGGAVTTVREDDSIRGCRPAVDAFRIDDKGKITIINPTKPYRNPYVS